MSSIESKGQISAEELERIYKEAEDYLEIEKSKGLPAKDWIRTGGAYCAGKMSEYLRFHSSQPISQRWSREAARSAAKEAYKSFAGLPSEFDEWFDATYPELPLQPIKEPVVEREKKIGFSLSEDDVRGLLENCLKPEEIGGSDEKKHDRISELIHWFARYARGSANGKWLIGHAFELAYYIATGSGNRHIDLEPIRLAAYKEGAMITSGERALLEKMGTIPAMPSPPSIQQEAIPEAWIEKATIAASMAYPESGMHKDGDKKTRAHQRAFVDGVKWLLKKVLIPDQPSNEVGENKRDMLPYLGYGEKPSLEQPEGEIPAEIHNVIRIAYDKGDTYDFDQFKAGAIAMYRHLTQSGGKSLSYWIAKANDTLQSELSALREEKETGDKFNGSLIDQLKRELKSAHEEREEYRKELALSVLKWAIDMHVSRAGKYWGKDYSNIAYDDKGIVEEYLKQHQ